jgi:hypothetical protein
VRAGCDVRIKNSDGNTARQVRKTPRLAQKLGQHTSAFCSRMFRDSHRNAWANLPRLGQPDTFLAFTHHIEQVYLWHQPNLVCNTQCTKDNLTPFSLPSWPSCSATRRWRSGCGRFSAPSGPLDPTVTMMTLEMIQC